MLTSIPFILLALAVILLAAELFTNAVEWLGQRLKLAEGAVGSVLAAVGTALPETIIPIIAIVMVGSEDAHSIGIGAILGAPFLLSTAAFAVTGLGVIFFRKHRLHGTNLHIDARVIRRDLGYFMVVYVCAVGASFLPHPVAKYAVAVVLLGLYAFYVYRTFADSHGGSIADQHDLHRLHLQRLLGRVEAPGLGLILLQLVGALALIIGGAHVFVEHLQHVATALSIPTLVLALIIAPLATELPEKFNSILWVRQGKDTLAMGNISGAMVFQSCIPSSVGLLFTSWELTEAALVSAGIALVSTGIAYGSLVQLGTLSAFVLARAGLFWVGFVGYVVVSLARE